MLIWYFPSTWGAEPENLDARYMVKSLKRFLSDSSLPWMLVHTCSSSDLNVLSAAVYMRGFTFSSYNHLNFLVLQP